MTDAVFVHPDPATAGRAVAERLLALADERARAGVRFAVAVSGGHSPEPMFRALAVAGGGPSRWLPWDVYWADERMVPPTSGESNYGLARRLWLEPVGLPASHVHPVRTDRSPEAAAGSYEAELRARLPAGSGSAAAALDAVVLGIGPDGHTASLFPGSRALEAADRWVVVEPAPGRPPLVPRVTLTLAGLARSRRCLFLAWGTEKRPAVAAALAPPRSGDRSACPPAGRVRPIDGVEWYLDRDAAPGGTGP